MGRRISIALLCAAAAVLVLVFSAQAPAAGGGGSVPDINWTHLLPPLDSPNEPQPGPVPHCRVSSPACVDTEVRRMTRLRDQFGCDHRAVFATTYLTLTKVFRRTLRTEHLYEHPHYLYTEDALFADMYFDTVHAWERGGKVPPAWRIAFKTAATGNANGAQDMLLGINAHVQNDMPFVVAALGLRTRQRRVPQAGPRRRQQRPPQGVRARRPRDPRPLRQPRRRHQQRRTPLDDSPASTSSGAGARRSGARPSGSTTQRPPPSAARSPRRSISTRAPRRRQSPNANLDLPPDYRSTRDDYCAAHPFR